jgi:hypothetical protein
LTVSSQSTFPLSVVTNGERWARAGLESRLADDLGLPQRLPPGITGILNPKSVYGARPRTSAFNFRERGGHADLLARHPARIVKYWGRSGCLVLSKPPEIERAARKIV